MLNTHHTYIPVYQTTTPPRGCTTLVLLVDHVSIKLASKETPLTGTCKTAHCAVAGGSVPSTSVMLQAGLEAGTTPTWGLGPPSCYTCSLHSSKQGIWRSVPARPGAHTRFAGGRANGSRIWGRPTRSGVMGQLPPKRMFMPSATCVALCHGK